MLTQSGTESPTEQNDFHFFCLPFLLDAKAGRAVERAGANNPAATRADADSRSSPKSRPDRRAISSSGFDPSGAEETL